MNGILTWNSSHDAGLQARVRCSPFNRCTTRSRKIFQFKHYCTDAPI